MLKRDFLNILWILLIISAIIVIFWPRPSLCLSQNITYVESNDDFPNPERGFVRWGGLGITSNYSTLDYTDLVGYRSLHTPPQTPPINHQVYSTLVYRPIILDQYMDTPEIPRSFLVNDLEIDFYNARRAGVKLILRFAYYYEYGANECTILEPDKQRIISHIESLSEALYDHKDVIALVQFGFIGNFGEGYNTMNPDFVCRQQAQTAVEWQNRTDVLMALLNNMPQDRMVQVRVPQMKQKAIFGPAALSSTISSIGTAINTPQPFDGSNESRIGFHNDCFLAAYNDLGTYTSYDGNHQASDASNLRSYMTNDSQYVAVGGETCAQNEPHDNCPNCNGGNVINELEAYHFSFLMSGWNPDVNNDWESCGCMDEIKKRLGYRFVLREGSYSENCVRGGKINISFTIDNVGFASPFNPRQVELILKSDSYEYYAVLEVDPRTWYPGTHQIEAEVCVPLDFIEGDYEYYLSLPDPETSLYHRPEYHIRLANSDVLFDQWGYNSLNGNLVILGSNTGNINQVCEAELIKR